MSETQTRTLEQVQRFLDTDSLARGYHYLVDVDGSVYSYVHESRGTRHTAGQNATTLGIGMVHVSGSSRYTTRQVDGLVALLAKLAHDHQVDVRKIQSKREVDRTRPSDITAQMTEIRRRVGALLGEWRLSGTQPADARPRVSTPPTP